VFAADTIQSLALRNRCAAVVNTDRLSGAGQHWWAIARLDKKLEIFDPLGVTAEEVVQRIGRKRCFYFNATSVQPEDSVNCGLFCIYWIYARLLNSELKYSEVLWPLLMCQQIIPNSPQVLNTYLTPNLLKNEAIVLEFEQTGTLFEDD
jgi:hypothetical protein